jgi:hypothetical protein
VTVTSVSPQPFVDTITIFGTRARDAVIGESAGICHISFFRRIEPNTTSRANIESFDTTKEVVVHVSVRVDPFFR